MVFSFSHQCLVNSREQALILYAPLYILPSVTTTIACVVISRIKMHRVTKSTLSTSCNRLKYVLLVLSSEEGINGNKIFFFFFDETAK